jgi:predicted nucleotidyltransferase
VPADDSEREQRLEALRRWLLARPEVVFAYLHGSFLIRGDYRDIDVAVWLEAARVPAAAYFDWGLDASVALRNALGTPVDVQVLNRASLAFRFHALKGQPIVVRDRETLDDVRARTWDDYFDFEPFARRYLRESLSG